MGLRYFAMQTSERNGSTMVWCTCNGEMGTTGTHMHIENTGQADLEFLHSAPAADSVATDPLFPSSVVYMYKPRPPSSLGYSEAA